MTAIASPVGENWSAMGVVGFVIIERPLCYLRLAGSGSSGAEGTAGGEEDGTTAACSATHFDR